MILSIRDRIVLFNILPEQGTFATVRAVHDLRMVLAPTEEEQKQIGYREDDSGAHWDSPLDAEVEITVEGFRVCKETLEALDKKAEITEEHVALYEKFVEGRTLVALAREA